MKRLILLINLLGVNVLSFSQITCTYYPPIPDQRYHRICLDSACIYISNFLQYETLKEQAEQHALGGFILIDHNKLLTKPALKFYPCYDDIFWIFRDQVFMAYEYDSAVDPENPNCDFVSVNPKLAKSNNSFFFRENGISPEEIAIFLSNQNDGYSNIVDSITKEDVSLLNSRFFEEYTAVGNQISLPIYHCSALFYDEVVKLASQKYLDETGAEKTVSGFRYYFGYDRYKTKSKLRIILIATKEDGKNLIYHQDGKEAILLERSWP